MLKMPDKKNNQSENSKDLSNTNSSTPSNMNPYNEFLDEISSPTAANMRPIWEGFTLDKDSE